MVISTKFLPSDPDEFCNRLKLLVHQKQAGNSSDILNDENIVILDIVLEHKCITHEHRKQVLIKCNLLYE